MPRLISTGRAADTGRAARPVTGRRGQYRHRVGPCHEHGCHMAQLAGHLLGPFGLRRKDRRWAFANLGCSVAWPSLRRHPRRREAPASGLKKPCQAAPVAPAGPGRARGCRCRSAHLVVIDLPGVFAGPGSDWFTPRFEEILEPVDRLVEAFAPRVSSRASSPRPPATEPGRPTTSGGRAALEPPSSPIYRLVDRYAASAGDPLTPRPSRSGAHRSWSESAGRLGGPRRGEHRLLRPLDGARRPPTPAPGARGRRCVRRGRRPEPRARPAGDGALRASDRAHQFSDGGRARRRRQLE